MSFKEIDISKLNIKAWRRVKDTVRLRLFELEDGSVWTTPAAIIAGRKTGPILTVVAGQHGDEWNGIFMAHHLFEEVELQDLTGTLVILPIANPFAFLQKSRISVLDQLDMNRSFGMRGERHPTSAAGSIMFNTIFRESNYLIDIHSGGPGRYLPNVGIVEQGRFEQASYFNTGTAILTYKDHGTLVRMCERNSVPAFSLQLGSSHEIDYRACDQTVLGILNFMRGISLIPEPPRTNAGQRLFTEKHLLLAPEAGFVSIDVSLNETVGAGQHVGEIEPLFSDPIEITASKGGHVVYARAAPMVNRGDSVVHLAEG